MRNFVFAALLSLVTFTASAQEIWTVGPMLHFNFGGEKKITTSFAIERAYWNLQGFPYGADFALEFDKGKFRIYSEFQTGVGVTGISFGPVLEFNRTESRTNLGVQGTFWVNYYLGVDYRFRVIGKNTIHAFGLYGKLPVADSGLDDADGDSDWDWDD